MTTAFNEAKKEYSAIGINVEAVFERLKSIPVSLHCWQGDDVTGFVGGALSGGIQATGNYPGKARTFDELKRDLEVVFSLIPGKKRLNLHAIYAVGATASRDNLTIKEFEPWLQWALERGVHIDFNPTLFACPGYSDTLTLSHPDCRVREFWIRHVKACRAIAAEIGKRQGTPCLHNIWIPDGLKDVPADRLGPRLRLKESLDEIFAVKYPSEHITDCMESKVFGIGVESYTVGSSEFYLNYAAKNNVSCLLDTGHYHPTEMVSDKISAMLAFYDKVALHVSRPVRWDSDHVIILEDELRAIAAEIVRNSAETRVLIGLDYFDASINRIAAWVIGARSMHKALLAALLTPWEELKALQDQGRFTELMYKTEEYKTYPFGAVWDEFLRREGVEGRDWLQSVLLYEKEVLSKR